MKPHLTLVRDLVRVTQQPRFWRENLRSEEISTLPREINIQDFSSRTTVRKNLEAILMGRQHTLEITVFVWESVQSRF